MLPSLVSNLIFSVPFLDLLQFQFQLQLQISLLIQFQCQLQVQLQILLLGQIQSISDSATDLIAVSDSVSGR